MVVGHRAQGAADLGPLEEDGEDADENRRRQRRRQLEPVHLHPAHDERGVGDADVELLHIGAPGHLAKALEEEVEPDGRHEQDDLRLVHERTEHDPFDGEGQRDHGQEGQPEGQGHRHALLHEPHQRESREEHHDALGKVEHARGLEDEDEAEGDQGVHEPGRDAAEEHLGEEGQVARHVREGSDEHPPEQLNHGRARDRRR